MDDTSENIKQFNLANNFFSPETSAKQSQQESVENESVAGIIDDTTEEATYDESNAGDESVRSKNENFGKTINETVELSDSGDNGDEDEEESESEESESVGDEEEEEEEEEEEDDDDDEENVVESKSGKPKVKSNAINETTESANEVSIQAKSEPSAIVIDSTDETATDKSEPFSKETSSSSEKDDSRSANEESKQLDESQGFDQANQTAESDIIQPKINRNKKKANRINDSDELPDIECSSSVVQNEKPNYRDEIENEEEASPPRVSSTEYRSAARDDSGPEIIELSDNDPSTPVRKPSQFQNPSNKAITGLLTLSKSAIKGDQRILSSWSPNYENYTPNTISRIKLERVKLKVKENQPIERKLKMLDIKDEVYQVQSQRALPDAASQMSNPSKLDKNDLRAQVAQGLNKQQTNRNYSYEEKLKSITDPMFESLEQKPDPEQNYDDFVNPKGLKVKLLPHQCYSMQWLKWREGEYPHGGILADDMGLGKTLTILGYLKLTKDIYERRQREKLQKLEDEEEEEEDQDEENDKENDIDDRKYLKRLKSKKNKLREEATSKRLKTLIVLPASLLHQWQGEINNKFEKNSFKVHVYHEANRKKYSYNLDDNDIVFTTYEIISREVNVPDKEGHIAKSVNR